MLVLNSPQVVQETALRWKREHRVALVTTMGALHEGHRALFRYARKHGTKVIASIFVNPLQFGPTEDFAKYPRPIEDDQLALEEEGVDLLFHPTVKDLYPDGFCSAVQVKDLSESLDGKFRPGHFEGVATVCLKLFQTTQADFAVYGEKDFQQLRVLQQMVADFNLPLTILPHPTVREPDGLALSSRNRFLSPDERRHATVLPTALIQAQARTADAQMTVAGIVGPLRDALKKAGFHIDYVEVAPAATLAPAEAGSRLTELATPRLLVAAKLGTTRLIDNVALDGSSIASPVPPAEPSE